MMYEKRLHINLGNGISTLSFSDKSNLLQLIDAFPNKLKFSRRQKDKASTLFCFESHIFEYKISLSHSVIVTTPPNNPQQKRFVILPKITNDSKRLDRKMTESGNTASKVMFAIDIFEPQDFTLKSVMTIKNSYVIKYIYDDTKRITAVLNLRKLVKQNSLPAIVIPNGSESSQIYFIAPNRGISYQQAIKHKSLIEKISLFRHAILDYQKRFLSNQIVHIDIKEDNILVDSNKPTVSIIDLGLSIRCNTENSIDTTTLLGREAHIPIDLHIGRRAYQAVFGRIAKNTATSNHDIFSFGMLLIHTLSRPLSYQAYIKHLNAMANCRRGNINKAKKQVQATIKALKKLVLDSVNAATAHIQPQSLQNNIVTALDDLLNGMLEAQPEQRLNVNQVLTALQNINRLILAPPPVRNIQLPNNNNNTDLGKRKREDWTVTGSAHKKHKLQDNK